MADDFDWCAEAARLRAEIAKLTEGRRATVHEFEGGSSGVRRRTHFQEVSLNQLRELLREATAKCEASKGGPPKRHAVY